MMRKCHLNTLPGGCSDPRPGAARQVLRQAGYVVNYFFFVAEEARQIMAQLGIRTFDELIGRVDLLDKSKAISHWKARGWTSPRFSIIRKSAPKSRRA